MLRFRIARAGVADTLEQPVPCGLMRVKRGMQLVGGQHQFGLRDDARDLRLTARHLRRHLRHGAGLAHRLQMRGRVAIPIGPTFDIDRLHHVMPGPCVAPKRVHLVDGGGVGRAVTPEVVVGVHNLALRVDCGLGDQSQPVVAQFDPRSPTRIAAPRLCHEAASFFL